MVKNYIVLILVFFLFADEVVNAQSFYRRSRKTGLTISAGLGTASYQGDLKAPRLNLDLKGAINAGIELPVEGKFSVRGDLTWYRISSDDKALESDDSPINRNLSFRSSNIDLTVMGVLQITPTGPRPRTDISTYVMAGIGGTYFNPKAELNGTFHKLRPLATEGESYSDVALVLPIGGGISYRMNYDWSIGLEAVYRFTTTDYLDDVSTNYLGVGAFETGSIAQQLSDRRPEIGLQPWPAGTQRGDPDDNDGYFVILAKLNYHLNQGLYYKRKTNRRSKIYRRR